MFLKITLILVEQFPVPYMEIHYISTLHLIRQPMHLNQRINKFYKQLETNIKLKLPDMEVKNTNAVMPIADRRKVLIAGFANALATVC